VDELLALEEQAPAVGQIPQAHGADRLERTGVLDQGRGPSRQTQRALSFLAGSGPLLDGVEGGMATPIGRSGGRWSTPAVPAGLWWDA
jgi:hypothetical protein